MRRAVVGERPEGGRPGRTAARHATANGFGVRQRCTCRPKNQDSRPNGRISGESFAIPQKLVQEVSDSSDF